MANLQGHKSTDKRKKNNQKTLKPNVSKGTFCASYIPNASHTHTQKKVFLHIQFSSQKRNIQPQLEIMNTELPTPHTIPSCSYMRRTKCKLTQQLLLNPGMQGVKQQKKPTSRLTGSPSQWMTVSGATMQWGAGSVSMTLISTARMPPRTRKMSPFMTGR